MKRVLIVDDSRTIEARLAKAIQNRFECEVILADSRKICLERLNKFKHFDIALLDLNLPDAPNGEVVDLVMKFNIPIIVLTGNENSIDKKILQQKGIIDYVIKDRSYAIEQATNLAYRYIHNKNHKALIVDDSKTFAFKLENICKRYNLQTVVANSGEEALGIIKKDQDIDIVFVDYIMNGMNGLDFTTEIRKEYKQDEISIIALSGAADKEVIPSFLKYGANDFLSKDFSEEELVARMGTQLNNLELFNEVKDRANKDFMTGLFNRRYLFENGIDMYKKAKKDKNNFCAAILDIDKFKNINDTYGHDIGDVAIKELSKLMQKQIGDDTLISRIGGEEFCILFNNVDKDTVKKRLESLREYIHTNVITVNKIHFSYTISIGLTSSFGKDFDDMIKTADLALYDAKQNGRNQIVIK